MRWYFLRVEGESRSRLKAGNWRQAQCSSACNARSMLPHSRPWPPLYRYDYVDKALMAPRQPQPYPQRRMFAFDPRQLMAYRPRAPPPPTQHYCPCLQAPVCRSRSLDDVRSETSEWDDGDADAWDKENRRHRSSVENLLGPSRRCRQVEPLNVAVTVLPITRSCYRELCNVEYSRENCSVLR